MRMEREGDPEGTQGREELGGAEGGENIVRIDYMREKKSICNKKIQKKRTIKQRFFKL